MPKEMTKEDIEEIVEASGEGARRAREAGLDGVQLHGSGGYLINNFMSPWSNKRTDKYGGSLMGRLRFALEIIERIRLKCGNDFPIGIRLSYNEMVEGGLLPEEMEVVCGILADAGVDALDISRGTYGSSRYLMPYVSVPVAVMSSSAERVKKLVDIPVMVAHRIQDPIVAEYVLAQGKADLIGMGRALIADPDLPKKAAAGHFEDVIPCIACNQGCLGKATHEPVPISCTVNPTVGRERETSLVPAHKAKRVLVAGGGPGGLEAARVAAMRGHKVMLYEKADRLGGQFNLAAVPPTKQEFAKPIHYLSTQVQKAGVKVELGKEVTPELVDDLKPDVVIVATGGIPIIPADIPGADKPIVATANDVLAGKVTAGDKVIIVGGGEVGCETADYMGERSARQITVVEMLKHVASDMLPWGKEFLMERLNGYGVNILTSAKVKEVLDDGVVFTKNGKEESIRGVNSVVLAIGVKPVNGLAEKMKGKVAEVYVIGDAKEPRQALDAIAEASELARQI
jgi:NADPH-dependent 2,4-dienoyl-CoA reductase/sulfur reductase-like enzyme